MIQPRSTRSPRPVRRRILTLLLALAVAVGVWAPLAPPATAQPAPPSTRTEPKTKGAEKLKPTSGDVERAADRKMIRTAPRGMAAFALWAQSMGQQAAGDTPVSAARVEADVAALDRLAPRAVRELARMKDHKAQRLLLAVARSELAPALQKSHPAFTGDVGFFFYTNLQRQLEQLGRAAGSRGQFTFLPLLPNRRSGATLAEFRREVPVDQDGDEISDAHDADIDGSGGTNAADVADNIWGIPDEFLVRTPFVAGPVEGAADATGPAWSSCFRSRESVPRFMTVAAASAFRTARRCRLLSGPKAVKPANTVPPTTTGAATVGSTLTASPGEWSGVPAPTFTYRWQYKDDLGNWPDIRGGGTQSYVIQPGDLGRLLRVNVTATNSAGSAEQIAFDVGPVTAGTAAAPENLSLPTIAGTPQVGSQLVASPGSWSGSPTGYGYSWQRSNGGTWAAIAGATAPAYTPTTDDIGYTLRASVTASNAGGQNAAESAATGAVPNPGQSPVNTAIPAVSGSPVVGTALTASPGSWTGTPAPTFRYAWQRSSAPDAWTTISGATGTTYTPVSADVGQSLRVTVTAANTDGSVNAPSTEVGPVTAAASGCAAGPTVDTDGDGVTDCREIAGFTLLVATTGTGSTTTRKVVSDPDNADTDGDRIGDGLEWQGSSSDPSTVDTDGDRLDDYAEYISYKSLPANVDSDGDAVVPNSNPRSADPRLLDGTEVNGYSLLGTTVSTSPTLSDTDGDSLNDFYEINNGGFNPVVADMPRLEVGVPDGVQTDIQIFTKRSGSTEVTNYQGTTTTSTDTTKTHTVDLTNTKTLATNTTTVDAGAKAGKAKGKPFAEVHLNLKSTWQTGTITDHQTGSTTDSTKSVQQRYQQYRKEVSTTGAETEAKGELSTAITLSNPGRITYTAKDVVVTAFRSDPNQPGVVEPIATLSLPDTASSITLAPGDTKGPYQVSSENVSSDVLVELLANPSGIIYSIPAPSLINPTTNQDYAVVGQSVQAQTAGITIDDGSNNPRTYLLATNVIRNADGSAAGVNIKKALATIPQLSYETCRQTDGREVLCSVGGVETKDVSNFWSLLTSTDLPLAGNFSDLLLNAGSVLRAVYVVDTDADGLFDPIENVYGTDVDNVDTDADSLTDYAETQTGWTVPAIGPNKAYQVYPSPLAADVDGDTSPDGCPGGTPTCGPERFAPESVRRTDPNLPDTNTDGLYDGQQDNGSVLAFCPGCYRTPDFALSIGTGPGTDVGQFNSGPGPIGVNPTTEEVYVADSDPDSEINRILKFGPDGKFQLAFGAGGNGAGQFGAITGIAVDASGNVYTTSRYWAPPCCTPTPPAGAQGQLQKFTANGLHVASVPLNANGVAVDDAGFVYALSKEPGDAQRLLKFNPTLQQSTTLYDGLACLPATTPTGNLPGPWSGLAVDSRGWFYVANGTAQPQGCLLGFTLIPSGNPVAFRSNDGSFFTGVASDPAGHLYVADAANSTVLKLNPSTFDTFLTIGAEGTDDGEFDRPSGIATDGDCNVYVADKGNFRVQKFSYDTGCS